MKISLRACFSALFAALIIILTIVLSSQIGSESTNIIKNEVGESLGETSFELADKMDHYMWSRFNEIEVLSILKALREGDTAETQLLLDQLKVQIPSFTWVGVTDKKGIVQAATNEILKGKSISERPVYEEAIEHPFIGDVHDAVLLAKLLPNPTNEPLQFVDISVPIMDDKGVFKGVLASHLSWAWASEIKESLKSSIQKENKNQEIFIVSPRNNTVILGPKSFIGKSLNLESIKRAQAKKDGWILEEWPDGKQYLTGFALGDGYEDYPGLGWIILVRESEESAFASVKDLKIYILLLGALMAVIFAVLGWFLAGILAKPLHNISQAADQLLLGRRVEIPVYKGIKDVEILSLSLSNLLHNLSKTESELGHMATLAHHDKLTGLPNRIGLDQYINQIVKGTDQETGNQTYTFLYLDLDGFKKVNDSLGHHSGDLLLELVSGRLKSNIGESFISRLGGDEFLVVLNTSMCNPIEKGKQVGETIVKLLREPFSIEKTKVQIGCSVGASVWPSHERDIFKVIRLADQALYMSKKRGKNQFSFYDIKYDM
ncbi:sensor domain-containing diguanylate cyclase [Domibacillus sp. DTU_2020_1001157_1_SI_ALB_TIR_016]|uniref:sensor domain-containing diguanylate cyclase n=1 Tax=Domibacillus sp. DTU_2020_1001157_1_SI_ALB_TIR_016 TaxID=3077789 RepID=UPI0028E54A05|nr:sensor domain-containing diguanylate cyclase [Domibacillus sp. DTU_2020_1001157_1_SI_ALB_TIR_016]WNS78713.1 sensor domain-containing diguanylate cyclase [Domibacillus sp. DTU_2020_1001157_1_SI_ALB_TIR_016]